MTPKLALDIGTRNIVGLLVERDAEGRLLILDGEVLAHEDRAMRDGQVHDIARVGQRVREVVQALARRNGVPLMSATVAAAGRALRTVESAVRIQVPRPGRVAPELLRQLVLQGIGEASDRLGGEVRSGFHCVGYSLGRYLLDGAALEQPVGQAGSWLEAKLIATFLPRVVTDALVAVVHEAGLVLGGLTLEPIAAAEVAMAPTMRALNLALVDVGAGTSDIAVTYGGAVVGYAMVPLAGDLFTEALAQHHLLDFPEAEALKVSWQCSLEERADTTLRATDVLGLPVEPRAGEIEELLESYLQRWSKAVAEEILSLNEGRRPAAVLAIGGASQTPGLAASLAAALGLPAARVGVRGSDLVREVDMGRLVAGTPLLQLLRGPAGVTPLGIAAVAASGPGFRLREIGVRLSPPWRDEDPLAERYREERRVQVLDLGAATVLDGLLAAGFAARELTGRPGLGLTVTIDGELRLVPALPGRLAEVRHGDQALPLEEPLPEDARLVVRLAVAGEGPATTLEDLWGAGRSLVYHVDGVKVDYVLIPRRDGRPVPWETAVSDGGSYQILPSLAELLEHVGVSAIEDSVVFEVEGVRQSLELGETSWTSGGRRLLPGDAVSPGEPLTRLRAERPWPLVRDVMPEAAAGFIAVSWEGRVVKVPTGTPSIREASGVAVDPAEPVRQGASYRYGPPKAPILADLLALVEQDVTQGAEAGGGLVLEVDGQPAEFTTTLQEGCRVSVRWSGGGAPLLR